MRSRQGALLLGVLAMLTMASLTGQQFGFGLTPFNYFNVGTAYNSLTKKEDGEDKSYDFKIPDAVRTVGLMPGLALEGAWRQGILITSVQLGFITTPNKSYIPPMGARFYAGVTGMGRIPLQRGRQSGDMDLGFLVGLGGNLTVGGATSQPSETKVLHVGLNLSLLLGVSMMFQRQFELYFTSGPYIGIDMEDYQRTGYDKSFLLIPWGFVLPQVGFRLWA